MTVAVRSTASLIAHAIAQGRMGVPDAAARTSPAPSAPSRTARARAARGEKKGGGIGDSARPEGDRRLFEVWHRALSTRTPAGEPWRKT